MNYYRLQDGTIRKIVPDSKGIYFLGRKDRSRFVVGYVGRSDSNLKQRLLKHNHKGKFKFFSFLTVSTKIDGFFLETEHWYLAKPSMLNKIHPSKPKGLKIEHPCDTIGRTMKKQYSGGNNYA